MSAITKNVRLESVDSQQQSSTFQFDSKAKLGLAAAAGILSVGVVWYLYRRKKRSRPDKDLTSDVTATDKHAGGDSKPISGGTKNLYTQKSGANKTTQSKEQQAHEVAKHLKGEGNSLFKQGDYAGAIKCYTDAIGHTQESTSSDKVELATFYQNRAAAYEKLHDYSKVLEDCNKALLLNDKYIKALFRRSKAYEHMDKLTESLQDMTAVCIVDSFSNATYLERADKILKRIAKEKAVHAFKTWEYILPSNYHIYNFLSSFIEEPAVEHAKIFDQQQQEQQSNGTDHLSGYEQALLCMKSREYDSVLALCERHLSALAASHPPHVASKRETRKQAATPSGEGATPNEHGDAPNDQGDAPNDQEATPNNQRDAPNDQEATPNEESVAAVRTWYSEARLLRATFNLLMGKMPEAISEFDELINDDDQQRTDRMVRCSALLKKSTALLQSNQHDEALQVAQMAVDAYPDLADVYHYRGQLNLLMEKIEKAIEDFTLASDMRPDYPIAQVQKCFAKYRFAVSTDNTSEQQAAISDFKDLCHRFSTCSEAHMLYAQVLMDQKQFEVAERVYNDLIQMDPLNPNLKVHKAMLVVQMRGDLDEATDLIQAAIQCDPKCEFAIETMGTINLQRGHIEGAISCFDQAVPLCRTEQEAEHIYSLREAAHAQRVVEARFRETGNAAGLPHPAGPLILG